MMKWEKHDRKNNLSKIEMIEIQSEAFYKALKRIESEKNMKEIPIEKDFSKKEKTIALLKAFICPKKIKTKYIKDKGITDNLFSMISSTIMIVMGHMIRIISLIILLYTIYYFIETCQWSILLLGGSLGMLSLLLGVFFVWSGDEIEKEKDSNKINIYTSNVFTLIGLIVAIIALAN